MGSNDHANHALLIPFLSNTTYEKGHHQCNGEDDEDDADQKKKSVGFCDIPIEIEIEIEIERRMSTPHQERISISVVQGFCLLCSALLCSALLCTTSTQVVASIHVSLR